MNGAIAITGGTSGIGRALVELYHREGWPVATCGRSAEALAALRSELPGVSCVEADLATAAGRLHFRDETVRAFGAVAGLVNNAAIQYRAHGDEACLQEEIGINLIAPIALGIAFAPHLSGPAPFIANVSSGLAYVPFGPAPVYSASKAGLSQYTKSMRRRSHRVRFVEIVLPLVDTRMTAGRGRGKISAHEAARRIALGIAAGRETIRVGMARLLPWATRLAPSLLERSINRADPALPE